MTIVGEHIFFSSVEVTVETERLEQSAGRYDRTTGEGEGHLFKMDREGNLLANITLGEDSIYHPGGIDFDGEFIWIPVAEYRPNSSSIVYRVDPSSMDAQEVFRVDDHLGALVFDTLDNTLHGVSWGSRFFYSWKLNGKSQITAPGLHQGGQRVANGSYYVDYQDCRYAEPHYMICGGVKEHEGFLIGDTVSIEFTLGGLDLIDLHSKRAVHQVPLNSRVESGQVLTNNPFFVEAVDDHLRFFFMPEDNESTVYIFDAIRE